MTREAKRRTPSRWGEGAVLREEILSAAARLLAESGREGDLSLRAVAREVGISAPSIYHHFKDRTELVAEVTRRAYARLIEELQQVSAAEDDPRRALQAMAQVYCQFAIDNPRHYRLMFGIERVENTDEDTPYSNWCGCGTKPSQLTAAVIPDSRRTSESPGSFVPHCTGSSRWPCPYRSRSIDGL
nr:TetR/AcrR family transcriptional regulator [Nocardia anaemiae]